MEKAFLDNCDLGPRDNFKPTSLILTELFLSDLVVRRSLHSEKIIWRGPNKRLQNSKIVTLSVRSLCPYFK